MDTTRRRWRAFVEWMVAAMLVGAGAAGVNMLGQIERVVPVTPVSAREPGVIAAPAAVPSRAVSVPMLLLAGNVRIQVGDAAADVLARIQGLVVASASAVERRAGGERITREFIYASGRFHLVTESSAADDSSRVTGIFVP